MHVSLHRRNTVARWLAAGLLLLVCTGAARAVAAGDAGLAAADATISLAEVLDLANTHHPTLAAARLRVTGARSSLAATRSGAGPGQPGLQLALQFLYGQDLAPDAGAADITLRQAELEMEQAVADYAGARLQILGAVERAYIEWQGAAALIKTRTAALERATTQADGVQTALAAGLATPAEALQAEAMVTAQRAALSVAEQAWHTALHALQRAMGATVPPGTAPAELAATTAAIDLDRLPPTRLVIMALHNRPDLRKARLDVAARRLDLDQLRAQLPPGSAAVASTWLQLQQAAWAFDDTAAAVATQVQQSQIAVWQARAALGARSAAVAPAAEALRITQLRYRLGSATQNEVQTALAALHEAEASVVEARRDLALAQAGLRHATGSITEP